MLGDFLVLFNLSEIKKNIYILILTCIDNNIHKHKNMAFNKSILCKIYLWFNAGKKTLSTCITQVQLEIWILVFEFRNIETDTFTQIQCFDAFKTCKIIVKTPLLFD